VEEEGSMYCVLQASHGQLHSMLGFPAFVLLELSRTKLAGASAYATAAEDLLQFIKGSGDLQDSSEAHVVAAAAASADDPGLATQVAEKLASRLRASGSHRVGEAQAIDHAVEAAFWLCRTNHSLASCASIGQKRKRRAKQALTTQPPEDEGSPAATKKRKKAAAAKAVEELEDEEELKETKRLRKAGTKTSEEHKRFGQGQEQLTQKNGKQLEKPEKMQEKKQQKEKQAEKKRKRLEDERSENKKEVSRTNGKTLGKHKMCGEGQAPSMPQEAKHHQTSKKNRKEKKQEEERGQKRKVR